MTSQSSLTGAQAAQKPAALPFVLLTPKEAATRLKVSVSWLAKARMRGDGPPYIQIGRSIRYTETGLINWMKVVPAVVDWRVVTAARSLAPDLRCRGRSGGCPKCPC